MPNVRGGKGEGFGGSAGAGRNSSSSSAGARAGDARSGGNVGGGVGPGSATGVPVGQRSYPGYAGPSVINGANTAMNAPSYGLSSSETAAYNSAKDEYGGRSLGKRVLDFLSPIKSIDPQINQPSSYAGGQYHHGFNPAGLAMGAISPYGSGLITGPLAGGLYNSMGGHNVVLTGPGSGFSTSYPDGGPGYNSSTGYGGANGAPSTPTGKMDQSGTAMGGFPGMPAGGAAFGPQPSSTPEMRNGGNPAPNNQGMFSPRLPNHSLPYGYQSAFPNSLSDEDKKLLYAKALMGSA